MNALGQLSGQLNNTLFFPFIYRVFLWKNAQVVRKFRALWSAQLVGEPELSFSGWRVHSHGALIGWRLAFVAGDAPPLE
jgi:hypothetical protein